MIQTWENQEQRTQLALSISGGTTRITVIKDTPPEILP